MIIEVVGILNGESGRSCEYHDVCGKSLTTGTPLVIRRIVVKGQEPALGVFRDDEMGCLVGFLRGASSIQKDSTIKWDLQSFHCQTTSSALPQNIAQNTDRATKSCISSHASVWTDVAQPALNPGDDIHGASQSHLVQILDIKFRIHMHAIRWKCDVNFVSAGIKKPLNRSCIDLLKK